MFPIRDQNPTSTTAYVTIGLIILNVLIFLLQSAQPPDGKQRFVWKYGYVPAELVQDSKEFDQQMREHPPVKQARDWRGRPLVNIFGRPIMVPVQGAVDSATALPAWLNIFTCMFLHGGWMHLLGNMLYLWIFGNNIEDKLGRVLFIVFYLGTGVVGNLAHTFFDRGFVPLVGASGAISGVMGAYILLFPRARILAVLPVGWYPMTFNLPAWLFLGIYILLQNLFPVFRGGAGNVAYLAHIGGFAAGMVFIYMFPHRKTPPVAQPVHPGGDWYDDEDADIVW